MLKADFKEYGASHDIRCAIVEYVVAHWDEMQLYTCDEHGNTYINADLYSMEMLKTTTYGSVSEVIAAAALGFTCFLLLLFAVSIVRCGGEPSCTQKTIGAAYLEVAMDMITRTQFHMASDFDCQPCPKDCVDCSKMKAADCTDVFNMGNKKSGVYEIWPMNRLMEGKSISVYCDMDTDGGGWTVIQRRGDFGSPKDYFYKDWQSYKEGFGRIKKDFWLGNDNIFVLTNQNLYSVRFDLMDVDKIKGYALYDNFWIDDEDHNYTLHISNYSGDAGDAMSDDDNMPFTTKDRHNDMFSRNCAVDNKGAWWYKKCSRANLNGIYHKGVHAGRWDGICWQPWRTILHSLEWTEIKIRPKSFRASQSPVIM